MTADEKRVHLLKRDHFAGCDQLDANDQPCNEAFGPFNAGRAHRFACHTHRTSWLVGLNLFSHWRDETEQEQRERYREIEHYRAVV